MSARSVGVWLIRIVRPDTRVPAPGIPLTVLDHLGNPAGHWVSDPSGIVEIPRSEVPVVRVRLGLRSETPIELDPFDLRRGTVELTAPRNVLPSLSADSQSVRTGGQAVAPRLEPNEDVPPQVLHYQRLGLLPSQPRATVSDRERPASTDPLAITGIPPVDFFDVSVNYPAPVRYGFVVDLEQSWQPLGYTLGDLLYSLALAPGDEARVTVRDGRGGRIRQAGSTEAAAEERPLQQLARMVSSQALVNALAFDDAPLPLESFTMASRAARMDDAVDAASTSSTRYLNDRTVRVSNVLRSCRAFAVSEVSPGGAAEGPVRLVRNTQADRVLTFQYFETLERYTVRCKVSGVRPAILVPFRMPTLGRVSVIRQYGYILRRALLDRSLVPELDRIAGTPTKPTESTDTENQMTEVRLVAYVRAGEAALDLWQASCFLHVDQTRYTLHFTPSDALAGGLTNASIPRTTNWIGSVRPADFQRRPLVVPAEVSIENASPTDLMLTTLHVEGRIHERWERLLTMTNVVLSAESRLQLANLAGPGGTDQSDSTQSQLLAHINANLPHYAAAIIAAGDPGLRYLALAKLRDPWGNPVADIIDNAVVGVTGNYIAFPLLSLESAPPDLQALFRQPPRTASWQDEVAVTVPSPGVWLKVQPGDALEAMAEIESGQSADDHSQEWPPARTAGGSA